MRVSNVEFVSCSTVGCSSAMSHFISAPCTPLGLADDFAECVLAELLTPPNYLILFYALSSLFFIK